MSAVSASQVCGCSYGNLVSSRTRFFTLPNFSKSLALSSRIREGAPRTRPRTVMQVIASDVYEISSQISQSIYSLSEEFADGPIELPPEFSDPFAIPAATPLQTAASIVLTGLITVLLFRSVQRRSKRGKEKKFRSFGEESVNQRSDSTSIKEDALKSATALLNKTPEIETPPPNALQTLSGAVVAGGIALILYKFTVTVQGGFVDKAVSTNYSIRNLTITVRTIVTGICYLATFVFAANSIGLTLLSLQLALNIGGAARDSKRDEKSSPPPQQQEQQLERSVDAAEEDRGSK